MSEELNTLLIWLAIASIPAIAGLLYALIRPWIISKVGLENLQKAEAIALMVVRAIDQSGDRIGLSGVEKKTMAFNTLEKFLKDAGVKFDPDLYNEYMDNFIESSVQKIRSEAPTGDKSD